MFSYLFTSACFSRSVNCGLFLHDFGVVSKNKESRQYVYISPYLYALKGVKFTPYFVFIDILCACAAFGVSCLAEKK